jgi:AcrR family transcriptional regulator
MTALRQFARDGYAAASVTTIAGELGMTKGALYKHYRNKRDIFDHIVARMQERDAENAKEFGAPESVLSKSTAAAYRDTTVENIKAFTIAQFRYWTEDEFACSFRRMLTLEQYRDEEMAELLHQYLTNGVLSYTQDLLREAAGLNGKRIKRAKRAQTAQILALEYFAPVYMMMNIADGMEDKGEAVRMVKRHIDYFMDSLQ